VIGSKVSINTLVVVLVSSVVACFKTGRETRNVRIWEEDDSMAHVRTSHRVSNVTIELAVLIVSALVACDNESCIDTSSSDIVGNQNIGALGHTI